MIKNYRPTFILIAIVFLAQIIFVGYFFIYQKESFASAINISGKQRMLSQRIALFVNSLTLAKDSDQKKKLVNNLRLSLDMFQSDHQALISGSSALNISSDMSEKLKEIYFQTPVFLDTQVREFIEMVTPILKDAEAGNISIPTYQLDNIINSATGILLQSLDMAVRQYQRDSDKEATTQHNIIYGISISMLVTLIMGIYQYIVFFKDMKAKNDSLAISRFVFDHTVDGVVITDSDGVIVTANSAVRDLIGYSTGAIIGRKIMSLIAEIALHESIISEMLDITRNKGEWRGELLQKNEFAKSLSLGIRAVYQDNNIANYVISMSDISRQKQSEEKFRLQSIHDPLTGLLNRAILHQEYNGKRELTRRDGKKLDVLMIDLDGFKQINDTYSHDAGDYVLKILSERFTTTLRLSDAIIRYGGDEFIVLALRNDTDNGSEIIAEKLLTAMDEPVIWQGEKLIIGISIGIATYPDHGEKLKTLIRKADSEMYRVKKEGKNSFSVYADNPSEKIKLVSQIIT